MAPNLHFKMSQFSVIIKKMYFQGPTLARFQTPAMKNAFVQLTGKEQDRKKERNSSLCSACDQYDRVLSYDQSF